MPGSEVPSAESPEVPPDLSPVVPPDVPTIVSVLNAERIVGCTWKAEDSRLACLEPPR
jgi:hypothetical protein